MLAEIAKLPKGTWHNSMTVDGYDEPVTLDGHADHFRYRHPCRLHRHQPARRRRGINVPLAYTTAYTVFGLGCVVATRIPNNAGSLEPLTVSAPEGCILNAPKPAAGLPRATSSARCCPTWCSAACARSMPDRVPAEGTSCLWNINVRGRVKGGDGGNYGFAHGHHLQRRHRCAADKDGLSATAYPCGVRARRSRSPRQ